MRTYDCFGYYDSNNADKYASIEISVPKNTSGNYIYKYYNISNGGKNGLIICFKSTDSAYNVELNNRELYFQKEFFKLENNPNLYKLGDNFDYSKPIYVITYHDDNESQYEGFAKNWMPCLKHFNTSSDWEDNCPPFIPARSGFGGLKRM